MHVKRPRHCRLWAPAPVGRRLASPDWEAAPGWLAADEREKPERASALAQWALVLPQVRRAAHKVTGSLAAVTGWVVVWQVRPAPVAFVA